MIQSLIHLIYLVGPRKLMSVMIRFKESYAIFQTTLVFLKSRKKFNLTNDFLSTVRKVVKDLPSDKLPASEIPIKTLKESTTFP